MHVDVGRNFHGKEVILKLLDAMAMYKLNKLYLHLTEDEGWRLEIPGIPELTQVRDNNWRFQDFGACTGWGWRLEVSSTSAFKFVHCAN